MSNVRRESVAQAISSVSGAEGIAKVRAHIVDSCISLEGDEPSVDRPRLDDQVLREIVEVELSLRSGIPYLKSVAQSVAKICYFQTNRYSPISNKVVAFPYTFFFTAERLAEVWSRNNSEIFRTMVEIANQHSQLDGSIRRAIRGRVQPTMCGYLGPDAITLAQSAKTAKELGNQGLSLVISRALVGRVSDGDYQRMLGLLLQDL